MKETTKKFIHIHTGLNPMSKPVACGDKTLVSVASSPYLFRLSFPTGFSEPFSFSFRCGSGLNCHCVSGTKKDLNAFKVDPDPDLGSF
jgi:hypothetical protein